MRRIFRIPIQYLLAVLFWLAMIAFMYYTLETNDLTLAAFLEDLENTARAEWYGPLVFMFLMIFLRPFTLVPTVILTALGGRIFGIEWGFVYGLISATLSATWPYWAGEWLASHEDESKPRNKGHGPLVKLRGRMGDFMRENTFFAVLTLRLAQTPYDIVSLTAGNSRVPYRAYMLATFIGNIPGAYVFAALGASIEGDIFDGNYAFNQEMLISSAVVFVLSLVAARVMQQRSTAPPKERTSSTSETPPPSDDDAPLHLSVIQRT